MKKFMLLLSLFAVSLNTICAEVQSGDLEKFKKQMVLEKYFKANRKQISLCGIAFIANSGFQECKIDAEAESKTNLNEALLVIKKQSAKDALKNYHITFITALRGIEAGIGERTFAYDQRQQALSDKMNEAQARFEMENED